MITKGTKFSPGTREDLKSAVDLCAGLWSEDGHHDVSHQGKMGLEKWVVDPHGMGSLLTVKLPAHTSIYIQNDAIIKMGLSTRISTKFKSGMSWGSWRSLTKVDSHNQPDDIVLAPPKSYGDIALFKVSSAMKIMQTSYLASSASVVMNVALVGGFRTRYAQDAMFAIQMSGTGVVAVHGNGEIVPIAVTYDKPVKIDNGHVVAWSSHLQQDVVKAVNHGDGVFGFLKNSFSSWMTEGLMLQFVGEGTVYVQTRPPFEKMFPPPVENDKKDLRL